MKRSSSFAVVLLAGTLVAVVSSSGGCSSAKAVGFAGDDSGAGDNGGSSGGPSGSSASSSSGGPLILGTEAGTNGGGQCTGGLCTQVPSGCTTSLSGTVYDPAGLNPLYNAVVFVPNDPGAKLPAITPGTHTCNTCDVSIGNFVAAATTDSRGRFLLKNVPAGTHIPFVVQMGKWRRTQFLSTITACKDNAVPASMSRLPRNQGEGDMPQMALLTGGCDDLGCFLTSLGIDKTEFSNPGGGGRVDIYTGGDAVAMGATNSAPTLSGGRSGGTAVNCSASACPLWSSKANLERYDMVMLACECSENQANKANKQPLHDWLAEGGKAFATHYQDTWFKDGPSDFHGVANWTPSSVASVPGPFKTDVSFPKGAALHDWLGASVALNADGTIPLNPDDVKTSVTTVNPPTIRWIFDSSTSADNVKYLSFLTPIGGIPGGSSSAPQYCGKAVFTDIHTSGQPSGNVPGDCTPGQTLTPQQKALEFLFFDLSSCVQDDIKPPAAPVQ